MSSLFAFIVGGITMPTVIAFLKKVFSYKTWKIEDYKRVYDPMNEFHQGHYNEINEHKFIVKNVSMFNWVLDSVEWAGEQSKPYLFISGDNGIIRLENEASYESIDPSCTFDGRDYPAGNTVIFPSEVLRITIQHTNDMDDKPLILKFKRYKDSDNLFNRFMDKVNSYKHSEVFNKSKIELQIP